MTDLEIIERCAKAMEIKPNADLVKSVNYAYALAHQGYNPLKNDEQAMALVKRFGLNIGQMTQGVKVFTSPLKGGMHEADDSNINRAICLCVASIAEPV